MTTSASSAIAHAWKVFAASVLLFLLHRALAFDFLRPVAMDADPTAAFAVGALSDIWIAFLLSLVAAMFGGFQKIGQNRRKFRGLLAKSLLVVVTVGVAIHQIYVQFFHFPIAPFHLTYAFDPQFLSANGGSLWDPRFWALVGIGGALIAEPWLVQQLERIPLKKHLMAYIALIVVSLIAHNRNIRYRVQWFIPAELQVNPAEQLYLSFKRHKEPPPLTSEQWNLLAPGKNPSHAQKRLEMLANKVTRSAPTDAEVVPFARNLKTNLSNTMDSGEKPLLLVVLMESMRPADTGIFAPAGATAPSPTPHFDELAENSVVFTRAFATGTVTRGAQEAVFCGFPGGRDTSLMRGGVHVPIRCLPEIAKQAQPGKRGTVFWLHGGDGRFDSQRAFWKRHGVDRLLTSTDFGEGVPRTSWGVGDVAFFNRAVKEIERHDRKGPGRYNLGMLLTVTHHIPWELPADAPSTMKKGLGASHPSYRTARYSDAALGRFVSALKTKNLWQRTVLIVASDHGTSLPPYYELYANKRSPEAWLKTHINLVVGGGLVEKTLAEAPHPRQRNRPVSQAGTAHFLAYLLGHRTARFPAESLFVAEKSVPVFADTGTGVFTPERGELFSYEDVVTRKTPPTRKRGLLAYRAFLHWTLELSAAHETTFTAAGARP